MSDKVAVVLDLAVVERYARDGTIEMEYSPVAEACRAALARPEGATWSGWIAEQRLRDKDFLHVTFEPQRPTDLPVLVIRLEEP